jgi:hypothetical protein
MLNPFILMAEPPNLALLFIKVLLIKQGSFVSSYLYPE